ncbi:MAG: DUF2877 domain-containing protein [Candidatus Dormibacterales bacterium]
MIAESHSSSELLGGLLFGATRRGSVLSVHDLKFGDYVVCLTTPRKPRMPNGVECAVSAGPDLKVAIGGGRLLIGELEIEPGPPWDPVPRLIGVHRQPAGPQPLASDLTWIAKSTPATDELIAGYVAGLVLLHHRRNRALQIAGRAWGQVNPASATMLRHAALGEVPEPVHHLLATGDIGPLLAFGSGGMLWLRGLVSAGLLLETDEPMTASAGPLSTPNRGLVAGHPRHI